jgi:Tfp pilus assembly protein PilO
MNLRAAYEELQSLDLRNPGTWSDWVYVFFSALAALVILVLGYYLMIGPGLEDLHRAQRRETELRKTFVAKAAKAAALPAYEAQLKQMKHDFGAMLQQLPGRSEVANLLNDVSQARIAAGLDEELFQPQSEQKHDFYAVVPNRIVVTGDYHQLAAFVSAVAALPRIVTIEDVAIDHVGGKAPPDRLRMTAEVRTYRYLEFSEQAAPAPGKGAHK